METREIQRKLRKNRGEDGSLGNGNNPVGSGGIFLGSGGKIPARSTKFTKLEGNVKERNENHVEAEEDPEKEEEEH